MSLPNFEIENSYLMLHPRFICGVDESGRGSLIGPVIAGAVIFDQTKSSQGINDSKLISAKKREELYEYITTHHIWAVGSASLEEIEEFNILNATKLACQRAIENLRIQPKIILVDGNMKFGDERFVSIIKGDQKSISIAAASIIAKVTRDKIARELHIEFPDYDWQQNKGYGTFAHRNAIKKYGISKYHRRSFCDA
jgi:ribonuclease HII